MTPATGSVRWLRGDPETFNRWLRITTATGAYDYEVEPVKAGVYRLWRLDPQTFSLVSYNIDVRYPHHPTCSCPDAIHRRQGACKHIKGLRAALDALPF